MGQGKWLAAKALLALSEDARSSLTQVNLGKLRYLEAKIALQLKEYGSYKAHLSQLGLSPLFAEIVCSFLTVEGEPSGTG